MGSVDVEFLFHLCERDQRLVSITLDSFFEIAQIFQIFDALAKMVHFLRKLLEGWLHGSASKVLLIRILPVFHSIHRNHIPFQSEEYAV